MKTWWVGRDEDAGDPVGLIRLFDLADDTAMFDLRISESERGKGVGTSAVQWLTERIFSSRTCSRIQDTTRQDNIVMRKILPRCGYAKDALAVRLAGPGRRRTVRLDRYAVVKSDWLAGVVTPVDWDDEPDHGSAREK